MNIENFKGFTSLNELLKNISQAKFSKTFKTI